MRKRAFTLIELLVVIAIIAILAAILFPVFAQAKTAAKKTADLNNTKQMATAQSIYLTDTDDVMPGLFFNFASCLPLDTTQCGYRSVWQIVMYPYIKNWEMLTGPGDSKTGVALTDTFNISYGYNYGYLSTLCPINDAYAQASLGCPATDVGSPASSSWYIGISSTSVNRPANIVMFADNGGKDRTDVGPLGSMVNPPDAWPSQKYFYGQASGVGWGKGCKNYYHISGGTKTGKWGDTDGYAARYADTGPVVFVDNHAKPMKVGNLASGTNWSSAILCTALKVSDYAKYQWDPRYDTGPQQ